MIKINLLGRKREKNPLQELLIKLGVKDVSWPTIKEWYLNGPGIKLTVILVAWYAIGYGFTSYTESELARLNVELANLSRKNNNLQAELDNKKGIRAQMTRLMEDEELIKKKIRVIESLSEDRKKVFSILNELTLIIPKEVWLDDIRLQSNKLMVTGVAWDFIPINKFLRALGSSVYFSEVRLQRVSVQDAPNYNPAVPKALQKLKKFELAMTMVTQENKAIK